MKPTQMHFTEAVIKLSVLIRYFDKSDLHMELVAREMAKFVSTVESLEWLTQTAINHMRSWSLTELRGIYCSRYRPADGVEESATETSVCADRERRYHEIEAD